MNIINLGQDRIDALEKMDRIDEKLLEEQAKSAEERDSKREFELLYAKFIAGLRLNTGSKMY